MDIKIISSNFIYEDGELTIKDVDVDDVLNEITEAGTDNLYEWIDTQDFLKKQVPVADVVSYYDELEILSHIDDEIIRGYLRDIAENKLTSESENN